MLLSEQVALAKQLDPKECSNETILSWSVLKVTVGDPNIHDVPWLPSYINQALKISIHMH